MKLLFKKITATVCVLALAASFVACEEDNGTDVASESSKPTAVVSATPLEQETATGEDSTEATTEAPTAKPTEVPTAEPTAVPRPSVGDVVEFGSYSQFSETSKDPIEWIILEEQDGKFFLISEKGLDCVNYHNVFCDTSWSSCDLREWLNGNFFENAFTDEEQTVISETTVVTKETTCIDDIDGEWVPCEHDEPFFIEGDGITEDKIYILSYDEAIHYFPTNESRLVYPTRYAKSRGAYVSDIGAAWWWLRGPSHEGQYAPFVRGTDGVALSCSGTRVEVGDNVVRPVLWVDCEYICKTNEMSEKEEFDTPPMFVESNEKPNSPLLGQKIEDFAITDCMNGAERTTLYEILQEKKAVVINFWYCDCSWCLKEMPYIDEAYALYREDLEVVALNPYDSINEIKYYKEEHFLSFTMTECTEAFAARLNLEAFPTFLVIDRNGVICAVECGAVTDVAVWTKIFEYFTSDSYETTICNGGFSDIV